MRRVLFGKIKLYLCVCKLVYYVGAKGVHFGNFLAHFIVMLTNRFTEGGNCGNYRDQSAYVGAAKDVDEAMILVRENNDKDDGRIWVNKYEFVD